MSKPRRLPKGAVLLVMFGAMMLSAALMAEDSQSTQYPAPRFPSYLKKPNSIDDVMPYARALARNESGLQGAGLGQAKSGQTLLLVPTATANDLIIAAVKKALEERGVHVQVVPDYKLLGVSREVVEQINEKTHTYTAEKGYMEAAGWISRFPRADEGSKKWLKEQRPDLYKLLFPEEAHLTGKLAEVQRKLLHVGDNIRDYLVAHPEVDGVYWGKGGTTALRRALYPLQDKYWGTLTWDNRWDVMSQIPYYPADVWLLTEEKTIEPLAYVDKLVATDPEGTNIHADINKIQATRWAKGVYQHGHLYMLPNQATTRFGYSIVNYPALQKEWLPREPMVLPDGVIAATKGHGGFYPRMVVHFTKGYISQVDGGGIYGDVFRLFLRYPHINDLTFPYHKHPGFWYLYECAWGTNPKYFRNPDAMAHGTLTPERSRAGVVHWGLGLEVRHDKDAPKDSVAWQKFITKHLQPQGHNFHMHNYFLTYKVRIRGAERWETLMDRGHLMSLDDPEVRALASRYGDADKILAEDWIPEIPGINAPGDYMKDYAPHPYDVAKSVIDKALDGTYSHYYPQQDKGVAAK